MDVTSLLDQELPRARRNGSPWSASSAAQRQLGVEALHEIDAETMATNICEVHSRTHGIWGLLQLGTTCEDQERKCQALGGQRLSSGRTLLPWHPPCTSLTAAHGEGKANSRTASRSAVQEQRVEPQDLGTRPSDKARVSDRALGCLQHTPRAAQRSSNVPALKQVQHLRAKLADL